MDRDMNDMLKERSEWGSLATFVPNKHKPVYNWLYYKEGFSKEIVFNLLKELEAKRNSTVLDPFCGSGTTLLACKQSGINSIGLDVMPVCVFASAVKTRDYDTGLLRRDKELVFSQKFRKVHADFPPLMKRAFNRHALDDIAFFMEAVSHIENTHSRDFLLLALISASMKVSYAWKDGGVIKIRKHPFPPLKLMFKRTARNMIRDLERLEVVPCRTIVEKCDARRMNIGNNTIDFIITSPPYLNNIDYTKVYAIENSFLGHPEPMIRSYIGEKQDAGFLPGLDLPPDARAYFKDMNEALKEMHRVCRPGANVAIVVGNAYYTQSEKHVESDIILAGLAESIGFKIREILVLNKRYALERRTVKKGVIRESAIVMEK